MHSVQDGQTYLDHTQPDRPNVQRINVMENPETKKASDAFGSYEKVIHKDGEEREKAAAAEHTYENADIKEEEGKKDDGKTDEGKKDEGKKEKETVVIVDPTSLDSGKGDCWTRFTKFCSENKCLVGWMCIIIILCVLFFGLYLSCRAARGSETAVPAPTSSPGVRTGTPAGPTAGSTAGPTAGPTAVPTAPPAPTAFILGTVTTINNYTAALADHTSKEFMTFEKSFEAAVMCFYAEDHPEYLEYYEDTQVTSIEAIGRNTVVHFEIYFSQLDNDDVAPPDAHSVLSTQLTNLGTLGTFVIINVGSLTKSQN